MAEIASPLETGSSFVDLPRRYTDRYHADKDGFPVAYEGINFNIAEFLKQRRKQYEDIKANPKALTSQLYNISSTGVISLPTYNDTKGFFCCLLDPQESLVEMSEGYPDPSKFCIHPRPKFDGNVFRLRFGPDVKDWYFLRVLNPRIEAPIVHEIHSEYALNALRKGSEIAKAYGFADEPSIKESFIGLDDFANEWIVGTVLAEELKARKSFALNNITEFIAANVCNAGVTPTFEVITRGGEEILFRLLTTPSDEMINKVTILDTIISPDPIVLNVIKKEHIVQILYQVVMALSELRLIGGFRHNNLNVGNLYSIPIPFELKVGPKTIKHAYTIRISDFSKASMTLIGGNRIYNYNPVSDLILSPDSIIQLPRYHLGVPYYIIDFDDMLMAQHNPLPYCNDLDFYTLLVSMISIPQIFDAFFRNPGDETLKVRIWDLIWFPENVSEMYERLRALSIEIHDGKEVPHTRYLEILRNIPLRCDAMKRVLSAIQDLI